MHCTWYEGETPVLAAWKPAEEHAAVEMSQVQPQTCERFTVGIS